MIFLTRLLIPQGLVNKTLVFCAILKAIVTYIVGIGIYFMMYSRMRMR